MFNSNDGSFPKAFILSFCLLRKRAKEKQFFFSDVFYWLICLKTNCYHIHHFVFVVKYAFPALLKAHLYPQISSKKINTWMWAYCDVYNGLICLKKCYHIHHFVFVFKYAYPALLKTYLYPQISGENLPHKCELTLMYIMGWYV